MIRLRLTLTLFFLSTFATAQEIRVNYCPSAPGPKQELNGLINSLEFREAEAIKKRDTIALLLLWERDFTRSVSQERVVDARTGLKYYSMYDRFVEQVTVTDSIAFTSGKNVVSEINPYQKVKTGEIEHFRHTWVKQNGIWKLRNKTISTKP